MQRQLVNSSRVDIMSHAAVVTFDWLDRKDNANKGRSSVHQFAVYVPEISQITFKFSVASSNFHLFAAGPLRARTGPGAAN